MNEVSFAKLGLIAAGIMLAWETLIGCIAALGIGFEPLPVMLGLALTMGFPVYLLSLRSLRAAAIGLWALFVYRWAVMCCLTGPFHMVNPLDWSWISLLPVSAILVSASTWTLSRVTAPARIGTLLDALRQPNPRRT